MIRIQILLQEIYSCKVPTIPSVLSFVYNKMFSFRIFCKYNTLKIQLQLYNPMYHPVLLPMLILTIFGASLLSRLKVFRMKGCNKAASLNSSKESTPSLLVSAILNSISTKNVTSLANPSSTGSPGVLVVVSGRDSEISEELETEESEVVELAEEPSKSLMDLPSSMPILVLRSSGV